MNYALLAGYALTGVAVTLAAIPLILRVCSRSPFLQRAADLHHDTKAPVARLGGLALVVAYVVLLLLPNGVSPIEIHEPRHKLLILLAPLAMFAIGFWDDLKPLGARKKLLLQILIAAATCGLGIGLENFKIPFSGRIIPLHEWGFFLAVLWLLATTNLINLVDGVDGLAGGICLMLMSLLAYECTSSLQLLSAGMAGACLGFLRYNFPPARIYMGDGGAYFLGFLVGLFSLLSSQKGNVLAALMAPMFVLGLPIVDVTLAILRRGLRGLPIFRPDRRHLHHHLLEMGFSRRKAVLGAYGVTLVFLLLGLLAFWSKNQLTPIILGVFALILILCAGGLRFSRDWFAVGRVVGNSLAMRQDVQAALCLTRWLTMEARRKDSAESLWLDLVFVAERLGFTSVKLATEGNVKSWRRPQAGTARSRFRQIILDGRGSLLELWTDQETSNDANRSEKPEPQGAEKLRARFADPRAFNIIADVLAEGWLAAVKNWEKQNGTRLRFPSSSLAADDTPHDEKLKPPAQPAA